MRDIITYPDSRLLQVSREIDIIDDSVRDIAGELVSWMGTRGAPGISAPQIGELIRMICVLYGAEIIVIVNPVIVKHSEQIMKSEEACMSVADGKMVFLVERWKQVVVSGKDLYGKNIQIKSRDLCSRALQHEIDHLDGRLVINGKLIGEIKDNLS